MLSQASSCHTGRATGRRQWSQRASRTACRRAKPTRAGEPVIVLARRGFQPLRRATPRRKQRVGCGCVTPAAESCSTLCSRDDSSRRIGQRHATDAGPTRGTARRAGFGAERVRIRGACELLREEEQVARTRRCREPDSRSNASAVAGRSICASRSNGMRLMTSRAGTLHGLFSNSARTPPGRRSEWMRRVTLNRCAGGM